MNELWIQAIGFVGVNLHSFSFLFPFSMIKKQLYISKAFSVHNTGGEMAVSLV